MCVIAEATSDLAEFGIRRTDLFLYWLFLGARKLNVQNAVRLFGIFEPLEVKLLATRKLF